MYIYLIYIYLGQIYKRRSNLYIRARYIKSEMDLCVDSLLTQTHKNNMGQICVVMMGVA